MLLCDVCFCPLISDHILLYNARYDDDVPAEHCYAYSQCSVARLMLQTSVT